MSIGYTTTCSSNIRNRAVEYLGSLAAMSDEQVGPYFLGAGSTREAYIFENDYVIKIPRFVVRFHDADNYSKDMVVRIIKRGVHQTETEIGVYRNCNDRHRYLVNPIVAYGKFLNMPFVIMPKLKIASEVTRFNVEDIDHFIEILNLCVPWTFSNDLSNFAACNGLYYNDLRENTDNFGIDASNRLLITDYGTCCGD